MDIVHLDSNKDLWYVQSLLSFNFQQVELQPYFLSPVFHYKILISFFPHSPTLLIFSSLYIS